MHVVRVEYEGDDGTGGSVVEPSLESSWPALTRLSWLLGLVYVDSGIEVEAIRYRTNWCLVVDGKSTASGPSTGPTVEREIDELWGQLHTLSRGYQLGRERGARDEAARPGRPRLDWVEEWTSSHPTDGPLSCCGVTDQALVRRAAEVLGNKVVRRYVTGWEDA